MRIIDWIHAVDPQWDFVTATAAIAKQIDVRVAISEAARRKLIESGMPEAKIRLLRNGVDLKRFRQAPVPESGGAHKILFAGRLGPIKRPALLVDIAVELRRLRPKDDFCFVVAGTGPEATLLESRLRRHKITSLFRLLGHADDVPALLAACAVVVIPSEAEGIPLIALEAFATGRPVLCSRVGAASELICATTGVLVNPGPDEAARFAAEIDTLLNHPERRRQMGEAARRMVAAKYSREEAQRGYRELFEE
jgi:glycogen(starch) synthase